MDIRNLFGSMSPTTNKTNNQTDKVVANHQAQADTVADEQTAKVTQERVTLTTVATRFTQAHSSLTTQPEVNRDRVAEIRKALAEGSYKVDAGRLAANMIRFESEFQKPRQ